MIGNPLEITDTVEHDGNTVTVRNGKILLVQFYKIGSKLILITVYLFLCFFHQSLSFCAEILQKVQGGKQSSVRILCHFFRCIPALHKGDALFPRIDVAKEIAHLKEEDEKRKAAAEAANKAKAEAEKKAAAPAAEESGVDFTHEAEIDFDTFCKVELRVAEVRACENLKESKKLLHLTVFDGERERCILSGIAKWFKPEDLIGKKIGIVCNLAPRPMMKGKYVSEGMIFAADTADGGCSIAFYGDDVPVGSRIH